jgi:hypothetical protein
MAFRNASIHGGEMTLWVNNARLTMSAPCRVVLQLQTFRCNAANVETGQKEKSPIQIAVLEHTLISEQKIASCEMRDRVWPFGHASDCRD